MKLLPPHLQKYIVEQNYEKYTPVDQACWRYILRQLKSFLSTHAHECYLEGLEKTGISIDRIPKISEISERLEKFGWRALPVSGFIPPAAFMELQSLSVLPIASDMRTLEHLSYTPAPDIVHEAAGHAPILVHHEFAAYLKKYAEVAKKAIISKEDLAVYEAIRDLSDLKENPNSTEFEVEAAQKNLDKVSREISHVSEASELSRMNWWTAEYGLIGSLENPKIFGAGLLSSVGESKWCLSSRVKKIPLSVACIQQSYDITEPQPQLFVASSFTDLSEVLDDMARQMAFRVGGKLGLDKAILAKSVNTFELDSGIQISGVIAKYSLDREGKISYIQTEGPTQICWQNSELSGHGRGYHQHGFGTTLGLLKGQLKSLAQMTRPELESLGICDGREARLEFSSGIDVSGRIHKILFINEMPVLISFSQCTVTDTSKTLFDPSWGIYDMALGNSVRSVFGGPADRISYGGLEDFVAKKVPIPEYSAVEKERHALYLKVRSLREGEGADSDELNQVYLHAKARFSTDWLLFLELYELCNKYETSVDLKKTLLEQLVGLKSSYELSSLIENGLDLAEKGL
jgi:phenylalanine-4-hydroxylase